MTLRVGLVQLTAGLDPAENAAVAVSCVAQAAQAGAQLVLTPEMTGVVDGKRERLQTVVRDEADDLVLAALRDEARRQAVWLLIGSLAVRLPAGDQLANRSFLIGPDGAVHARYDKLHLFDVDLPGGERYRESSSYAPGAAAVLAQTPWGGLGLTICYDLRFAALYRALAKAGARIIAVPSAFTQVSGEAHWHVLLRARAIETGCFILAPAQCGTHADGRRTFGHSLVVSPWGEVLADGGPAPGVVFADLALGAVDEARSRIPQLKHDRAFDVDKVPLA